MAILTKHSVDFRRYEQSDSRPVPSLIQVDGTPTTFFFKFKSASSNINVVHNHLSAKAPDVQHSNSVDEPHILSHTVNRPIIQEVREVITPFRRVVQDLRPVVETVKTLVNSRHDSRDTTRVKADLSKDHMLSVRIPDLLTKEDNSLPLEMVHNRRLPLLETTWSPAEHSVWDNLIDNTLYSGTSIYDLKYVSPNMEILANNKTNYLLYENLRLYRD